MYDNGDMPTSPAAKTIPALHKAIAVVKMIAEQTAPVSVKELAITLNIPQASCYRIVRTLLQHQWVQEEPRGGYRIAFGLANLTRSYSAIEQALSKLEAPLRQLSRKLELSAKITLREGHFAVTALRAEPSKPNAITSPVGHRFHLSIGSAAATLLAGLDDATIRAILETAPPDSWKKQTPKDVWRRISTCREQGISWDLGQQHPSIYALSIPIRLTEDVTAALSVVGWPSDFEGKKRREIERALRGGLRPSEE